MKGVKGFDNWQTVGESARRALMSHPAFSAAQVCSLCAVDAGGRWPIGHQVAFGFDTCILCENKKRVTAAANWSWIEQ